MTSALSVLAVLVAAALLVACGDDDEPLATGGGTTAPGGAALAEEYVSVEVSEDGTARPLVDGTTITMRFDGDRLGASLGCNQLGAPYEIDGDRLTLATDGTEVVLVDREVAEPDASLVDTTWEVTGFADGQDPGDTAMSMAVQEPGIVRSRTTGSSPARTGATSSATAATRALPGPWVVAARWTATGCRFGDRFTRSGW